MVDWSLARQIARFAAGSPTTAPRLDADLPALVEESAGHLRAYTELEPSAPMPAPEPLGRAEWAEVNLDSLPSRSGWATGYPRPGRLPAPCAP